MIGTWHLIEWRSQIGNGLSFCPFGEDAIGQITLSTDESATVWLMKADWPSQDRSQPEAEEGLVAYTGTFALIGNEIHHTISFSTRPEWIGSTLVRNFTFDGTEFVTTTQPKETKSGKLVTSTSRWRRGFPKPIALPAQIA